MADARFAIELTSPDGDTAEVYVVACCARGALSTVWDEDGERWQDTYDGWDAKVAWSEDPDDGTPDTGEDVCEDCQDVPDFADVEAGLPSGVYLATYLNPPGGEDCTHLLVREDGTLGWCYPDGTQSEDFHGRVSRFTAEDLCSEDA